MCTFIYVCHICLSSTGCPKIKSGLGKPLEIAIHGFKLCILYVKREKFGPNPSRPFLGHPWMHAISIKPHWTPQVLPGVFTIVKYPKDDFIFGHPVFEWNKILFKYFNFNIDV